MSSRYYYGVHLLPATWVIDTVQLTITVDTIVYGNPKCRDMSGDWQVLDAEQRQCMAHTLVFSRSFGRDTNHISVICSTQALPGGEAIRFYRMV